MKKHVAFVAALLVGAACGGSDNQNAAVGKTFTYGAATSQSTPAALETQLGGAIALTSATDPSGVESISDPSAITSALLGDSGVGTTLLTAATPKQALSMAGASVAQRLAVSADSGTFDNPGCVTTTATSYALNGCKVTITDSSGTGTITASGNGNLVAANGTWTLTWNFQVTLDLKSTSGESISATATRNGNLAVTSTTIDGSVLTDVGASWNVQGNSGSAALSEAVLLKDLTYTKSPDCITGGTLEAKRVWKKIPTGSSAADFHDAGALVTWQGCGIVTVALSN